MQPPDWVGSFIHERSRRSHGQRSSSVSGVPPRIFAIASALWNSSASA